MVVGIIYGSLMLVVGIIIAALLISGKCVNINVKHISECKEVKDYYPNPGKPEPDTMPDLNKLTEEANRNLPKEAVNMDGVISEVNKVMGIETIETPNQEENK